VVKSDRLGSKAEMPEAEGKGSRWISRLLPAAVRFWLQSQAEHIENLVFDIQGRDRQILQGHLPGVTLSAEKAIYQGMHLSQIAVEAANIRVNLGQIVRGKPLRLLAPFPVSGRLCLSAADLNASLNSELLGTGLYDFLTQFAAAQADGADLQAVLAACPDKTVQPHYDAHATLGSDTITLQLTPRPGEAIPAIAIETGLVVEAGRYLKLQDPHWLPNGSGQRQALTELHGFSIDLGPEVALTECAIAPNQMVLAGNLQVLP
jgi:hypothetical protein